MTEELGSKEQGEVAMIISRQTLLEQNTGPTLDDVENQQPDGARKWKPYASPLWRN